MQHRLRLCICPALLIAATQASSQDSESSAGIDVDAPTAEEIADRWRRRMAGLDDLTVHSRQRVSYLQLESTAVANLEKNALQAMAEHRDEVQSIEVRIEASMTRDTYEVRMWDANDANDVNRENPVTEVILRLKEGVPTVLERQWRPVMNDYRTVEYVSPRRTGYDDPTLPSSLFQSLDTRVCATAEFFQTWLGDDSYQAELCRSSLAEATFRPVNIEDYRGRPAYRLTQQPYEDEEPNAYLASLVTYWIDVEAELLVRWRTELVSLQYGNYQAYQVVERHYQYPHIIQFPKTIEEELQHVASIPVELNATKGSDSDGADQD